jgi:site-specific DNA recombinase
MKAYILARVSTEEQKEAGNSLPAQQRRLREYIDRTERLQLDKEYIFDESAYKEHRKEFQKIIDDILAQKEIIALCGDKVDRLTRDFLVGLPSLERLRREGKIELHFPSDNLVLHQNSPATDLFHFNIAVSLAQYYSNAISDNTKRGNEQKRKRGDWTGKVRLGYKNIQEVDADGKIIKKDIIIDPERGHLIQRLFELFSTGNYSITTVWHEITRLGLKSEDGKPLARSNIGLILHDPFFYGMALSHKYGMYPHRYPTLITRELFEKCQDVLFGRRRVTSKPLSDIFIFKGLLRCPKCACMMTPEIKKGKFIYYSCTNAKGICKREYVPEKTLLEPVYEVFKAFASISQQVQERLCTELRTLNEGEAEFHNREIARLRSEYDRAQKKIETLLDLRLEQSITKDEYDKKLQDLKDKQFRLNIELDEYTKADFEYHIQVGTVLNLSRRIGEIFESSETHEKRAILNFLLQNPTVHGKKLEFTLRKPFDTVLELSSCLTGLDLLTEVRTILLRGESEFYYRCPAFAMPV